MYKNIYKINLSKNNIGLYSFNLGVFFLLSVPSLSGLLLLISLIISTLKRKENYFKDKVNHIFIASSISLLLSCTLNNLPVFKHNLTGYENYLNWLGLFNWIPYFYCLWAFQPYINSEFSRKNTAKYLISGSIPLLITGIGQYWFNWYGPLKTLNGLIIWFQRPLEVTDGLTGLFNNQNYAGSWLVVIFPFLIALIYEKTHSNLKRFFLFIFISFIWILIYYTKSRNALLGSILSIQLITLSKLIFFVSLLIIFLFIFFYLLITKLAIFSGIKNSLGYFLNQITFTNFADLSLNFNNYTRLIIFKDGFKFFLERPLLGWGSASFPILYFEKNNIWFGHSHNIFLELLISYGLICASIITFGIILILFRSFKKIYIYNKDNIKGGVFDKAWWTAATVLLFSQLFDIQFTDFRISMIFWILLSGLSTMKLFRK